MFCLEHENRHVLLLCLNFAGFQQEGKDDMPKGYFKKPQLTPCIKYYAWSVGLHHFCLVMGFLREMLCCLGGLHWCSSAADTSLCSDPFSEDWWFGASARDHDHWCLFNWDCSGEFQACCRLRWDITFWVHNIAGRGLMGEECAFFRESAPVEHVQAATSCWSLLGCITGRM